MTLGGNFAQDRPVKSGNSFAENKPTQGTSFAKDRTPQDDHIFEGDNTGGGVYSGESTTYGDIYGAGIYGGFTHFKNRTESTPSHS